MSTRKTAKKKTPHAARRNQGRRDRTTGVSVNRIQSPSSPGRPRVEVRALAFGDLVGDRPATCARGRKGTPKLQVPYRLDEITEVDMRWCEISIRSGVTPHVAIMKHFGVSYDVAHAWRTEGAKDDCPDPMRRAFSMRVEKAWAEARATAEGSVLLAEPRFFLTQGPAGQTGPEKWGESKTMRLTDETGNGPARIMLVPVPGGGYRKVEADLQPAIAAEAV